MVIGFDLVAAEFDDDADDLLDYFEKTWIDERTRRGKKSINFDFSYVVFYGPDVKNSSLITLCGTFTIASWLIYPGLTIL